MLKFLAILVAAQAALAAPGSDSIVSPELQSALQNKQATANIFLTFRNTTAHILESIVGTTFPDRTSKLNALHSALVDHATKIQAPVTAFLDRKATVEYKSFWISNQLYVIDADVSLIFELASSFEDIVSSIDEEFMAQLIDPTEIRFPVQPSPNHEWGVLKIQAPDAWNEIGGIDKAGEGVVVATVDTGVRVTHQALKDNFLGQYGWLDPSTSTPGPTDQNGHGTHTTGTICGSNGIGVAPKAKWAACRGCASIFCSQYDLTACGQFFACPTLADGSSADCSKAPNLVSNSWGGGRGTTWFSPVIDAWRAAEIIPLFSNGNSGPSCNTANSPADNPNVLGVGSTMNTDAISSFSSVGPTVDGRMKPEISAPGSDVISAYHTADDAYASLSGTSMATPHAAGTIALLQTREKRITYEKAKGLLLGHTEKKLTFSGRVCENIGDDVFPNHVFGHGRISALNSVKAQTLTLGK